MIILVAIILISLLICIPKLWIYKQIDSKKVLLPTLVLTSGVFFLLYGKLIMSDDLVNILIVIPISSIILIISWILFRSLLRKNGQIELDKKKKTVQLISTLMIGVILVTPSLSSQNKLYLFQDDYYEVADELFEAYDKGSVAVKDEFNPNYDSDEVEEIFPSSTFNKMKTLHRFANVENFIFADKDVIYFTFGANFQSISGIAITRNEKSLSNDEALRGRFFDGAIRFSYKQENAYLFYDGL